MKVYNLCFLGFGNVGRALARLLVVKSAELRDLYGIEWRISGIATRSIGRLARAEGFDPAHLASSESLAGQSRRCNGLREWLQAAQPHIDHPTEHCEHSEQV